MRRYLLKSPKYSHHPGNEEEKSGRRKIRDDCD